MEDEALTAGLNDIIKRRLDNNKLHLDEKVVEEYLTLASSIQEHSFNNIKT